MECCRLRARESRSRRIERESLLPASHPKHCGSCSKDLTLADFHRGQTACKACGVMIRRNSDALNREGRRKFNREYIKRRRHADPLIRLKNQTRSRIGEIIRRSGYRKNGRTLEVLGCEWEDLKRHIESQFKRGMTWSNYGDWHVDHRIPLSSATTESELLYLCHYLNLQPLWAKANQIKSNKMPDNVQLHLPIR